MTPDSTERWFLPEDRLLTPEDVADLLSVDREWVYRRARSGYLPAIKIGKFWRFRESAIRRFLADSESGGRD
jgi:excisionase family DNA binding protein